MPKAILSVYDKTGLVDLARGLTDLGWELIASGGTAGLLRQNNLSVTEVSDYTGSPEILGGRVKTLHPAIHGGILARGNPADQDELSRLGWDGIDLVVVNLYPFEEVAGKPDATNSEIIENIDIGGVTLIRAAAKNYERVYLLCDPSDYPKALANLKQCMVNAEERKRLAVKGFALTAHYDQMIYQHLGGPQQETLHLYPVQPLRYGENPHQEAILLGYQPGDTPLGGKILQGKELSYNNLLDLDAAWRAVLSLEEMSVVIVKHLSPCGMASADLLLDAYLQALECDPVSAFGGIVAANTGIDADTAHELKKLFLECVVAPGFSAEARQILSEKSNLRLLEMPNLNLSPPFEYRSVNNGLLKQTIDLGDPSEAGWKVVTRREPTKEEWQSLRFAWKACQHVKSNAIVFARGRKTVGIGGGQPNRVDCVRMAVQRSGEKAKGAVMASDAFFPFSDSVEIASDAGITAVIHPGGSIRDRESIKVADGIDMAMVTTGVRHFRH